jgi:DNA-binding transcriptional LysR family regulator
VHLPSVFARYHEAHPAVTLSLASMVTSELLEEVREHRLDCAIVNTLPRDPELRCDRVRTERLVLATARSVRDPFELSPATFLAARAGGAQRARVEAWWHEAGGPPVEVIELPSIGLRLSFAAAGIGVTALPASALAVLGVERTLRLHPIAEPWCLQDVTLVTRVDAAPFAALEAFRAMLLEAYGGG